MATKLLSISFFLPMISALAAAAPLPDFTGRISAPPQVTSDPATGFQTIQFPIEISNLGAGAFNGVLHVKPFALPTDTQAADSDLQDGVVLDSADFTVDLPPQATISVVYSSVLPLMRNAPWMVSVFINSNRLAPDSNTLNDVTDLVEAGTLAVNAAPGESSATTFDVYSEIQGSLAPGNGGVSHALRTIVKGDYRQFPSSTLNSHALWARFLAADTQTKKIYTLPYGRNSEVDKNWYSISYRKEINRQSEPVMVDYYNQAPVFGSIPPGKYRFLTLMNSRDTLPESNIHNDLDVAPLSIAPLQPALLNQIWFVKTPSSAAALIANIPLLSEYAGGCAWTAVQKGFIPGLMLTANSGTATPKTSYLPIVVPTAGLSNGTYQGSVEFTCAETPFLTQAVPLRLFVQDLNRPLFEVSTAKLRFVSDQAVPPPPQELTIRNTGSDLLEWALPQSNGFVTVSDRNGILFPGESQRISVSVSAYGLGKGNRTVPLTFMTNTGTSSAVAIDYNLN